MYSLYNGGYASYTAIIQRNRIQLAMQDLYSRGAGSAVVQTAVVGQTDAAELFKDARQHTRVR